MDPGRLGTPHEGHKEASWLASKDLPQLGQLADIPSTFELQLEQYELPSSVRSLGIAIGLPR
jgi:hypothetical protein